MSNQLYEAVNLPELPKENGKYFTDNGELIFRVVNGGSSIRQQWFTTDHKSGNPTYWLRPVSIEGVPSDIDIQEHAQDLYSTDFNKKITCIHAASWMRSRLAPLVAERDKEMAEFAEWMDEKRMARNMAGWVNWNIEELPFHPTTAQLLAAFRGRDT